MISILQMAQRAGTVYVRPDPGGWLARRCVGQPGTPEFAIDGDPLLLVEPVALDPSLVREVASGAKLHHITGPGMPLRVRPEVGYTRWSVRLRAEQTADEAGGPKVRLVKDGLEEPGYDPDSATEAALREGFILERPQPVAAGALLVNEGALDLLRADASEAAPAPAADEGLDALREVRDILREVVHSDVVQGLLALRGRKTLVRLLLGVVPTHVAASMLPGAEKDAGLTLRRLGLISDKLGNRGGAVVLDRLRRGLAGDDPKPTSSRLPGGTGARGELKRSKLFD